MHDPPAPPPPPPPKLRARIKTLGLGGRRCRRRVNPETASDYLGIIRVPVLWQQQQQRSTQSIHRVDGSGIAPEDSRLLTDVAPDGPGESGGDRLEGGDGEILQPGGQHLCLGYTRTRDRDAFDGEGCGYHTGDIGVLDAGRLTQPNHRRKAM